MTAAYMESTKISSPAESVLVGNLDSSAYHYRSLETSGGRRELHYYHKIIIYKLLRESR